MELSDWFKGFEAGIAQLTETQRETFFCECGKNCVQGGTLQVYKDLYEQADGDLGLCLYTYALRMLQAKYPLRSVGTVERKTFSSNALPFNPARGTHM